MRLFVDALTCGHRARTVTQSVRAVDPDATVNIDLGSRHATIVGELTVDQAIAGLASAGYTAVSTERSAHDRRAAGSGSEGA